MVLTITIRHVQYTLAIAICCILTTIFSPRVDAQKMSIAYKDYINRYADEGIKQMKSHAIPASITIAQGLLESGAGKSELASIHNNHFGIKCHRSWQGKKTYKSDDLPNECFRSYENAIDSYNDHSNFLKQSRYKGLYSLKKKDYRAWAKGLQKCGYATDKGYANKLIAIIELYELYELDKGKYPKWMAGRPTISIDQKTPRASGTVHEAFISYDLLYVIAQPGDTFTSIANEMGISPKKIARYNEAPIDFPLNKGDIVYLQKKNRKAKAEYPDHVVTIGESMHSIAQLYGISVSSLYRMNDLDPEEYIPTEGDVLILR